MKLKKRKHFWIGILFTVFFIYVESGNIGPLVNLKQRLEGLLYDVRLNATLPEVPRNVDELVVVVDIDEKSMREQGRFPWSRIKIAELVEALGEAGAIVVAFDIFFAEPENNPVDQIAERIDMPETAFNLPLNDLKTLVDADSAFSETLQNYDVVLGFLLMNEQELTVGGTLKTAVDWPFQDRQNSVVTKYRGVISNIETLQSAAIGLGFINAHVDADGFIRKAALVNRYDNELYPSIALEAARLYSLAESINTRSNFDKEANINFFDGVALNDQFVPTDEYGQILIPYKGGARSFPYYSATDVLNNRLPEGTLEGAVVFIGTSAVGLADLRATPVGLQYPGVEVHANVFEGIMHPEIVPYVPSWALGFTLMQLAVLGILLSLILAHRNALFIVWVSAFVLVGIVLLNFYLWTDMKMSLPLWSPVLLIITLASHFVVAGFISETNIKKSITDMFGQYVPPDHIDELMTASGDINQQSERREMSVLFSDIRSFTALSENLSPNELSEFLNEYLSSVTEIIFNHKGTIDKYVGDMVMAFWNAPLEDKEHAQNAVATAQAMIGSLTEVNARFREKNWPQVSIGIGISTGDMNVGDMGSHFRKAYTVLGDAVNLGARLESLTKFYGVDILVSEQTKLDCQDILFRYIDKVQVVGKQYFVEIYEPLPKDDSNQGRIETELELHQQAIDCYCNRDWQQAQELFIKLSANSIFSNKIYDIYLERISTMEVDELPAEWHGEFIHKNK